MRSTRTTACSSRAVLIIAAWVLAACGGGPATPAGTSSPAVTTSTSSSATTPPTTPPITPVTTPATTPPATPTTLTGLPIYFVGHSAGSLKLFREFRTARKIDGPISSAVSAMTRLRPLDPDYVNPWRPASRVWVGQRGSTLTVDISADAFANTNVGSELAARAVQQLVYTATAAAHVAGHDATSVIITVAGKPADAWGVIRLGVPMERAPMVEVQAHAWITDPQEGDVVRSSTVTFTGYGTSFEGTFVWRIMRADGGRVAEGSVMGGTGAGGFGDLRWAVRLAPGAYIVRLATDDPSGGAAPGGAAVDTKSFTVR